MIELACCVPSAFLDCVRFAAGARWVTPVPLSLEIDTPDGWRDLREYPPTGTPPYSLRLPENSIITYVRELENYQHWFGVARLPDFTYCALRPASGLDGELAAESPGAVPDVRVFSLENAFSLFSELMPLEEAEYPIADFSGREFPVMRPPTPIIGLETERVHKSWKSESGESFWSGEMLTLPQGSWGIFGGKDDRLCALTYPRGDGLGGAVMLERIRGLNDGTEKDLPLYVILEFVPFMLAAVRIEKMIHDAMRLKAKQREDDERFYSGD